MASYKASSFVKLGSCLRYLIDVGEGSAIGRGRPSPGQNPESYLNHRGEKIQESANVLANMRLVEGLLDAVGFRNVRPAAQEYLRTHLIPAANAAMHEDGGFGVLTSELAAQISGNAREIRKGVIERAKGITLFDEEGGESWPEEFKSELLWPVPWWIVVAFVSWFAAGVAVSETPLYDMAKRLFVEAPIESTPDPGAGTSAADSSAGAEGQSN